MRVLSFLRVGVIPELCISRDLVFRLCGLAFVVLLYFSGLMRVLVVLVILWFWVFGGFASLFVLVCILGCLCLGFGLL